MWRKCPGAEQQVKSGSAYLSIRSPLAAVVIFPQRRAGAVGGQRPHLLHLLDRHGVLARFIPQEGISAPGRWATGRIFWISDPSQPLAAPSGGG